MPCDFFNRKNFIVYCYKLCTIRKGLFWNVCARQPGGVHHAAQFAWSRIYTQLGRRDILSKPILEIGGVEIRPYLRGDSAYHSHPYLWKFFKANVTDPRFNDKKNSINLWIRAWLSLSMHLEHLRIDGEFLSILIWIWTKLPQWPSHVVFFITFVRFMPSGFRCQRT